MLGILSLWSLVNIPFLLKNRYNEYSIKITPSFLQMKKVNVEEVAFHVAGDAYVDFFCFLDDGGWPENGGDSRLVEPVKTCAGGSSTNTATHLRSLQRNFTNHSPRVYLHTVLNPEDHYGQLLLGHASDQGFPIINCRKKSGNLSTGHCIAIVSGGERSFMTHQGCVDDFKAEDLSVQDIVSTGSDVHLHIAGFYNIPGFWNRQLEHKLEELRSSRTNATISLVTQHDATKEWDGGFDSLLPWLDFAIMNDLEARHIVRRGQAGKKSSDDDKNEIQNLADHFGSVSPETYVIVTRGELGAVALKGGKVVANQYTVAVKPVDPTGAGDSFTAGFIHGIWTWRDEAARSPEEDAAEPWPVAAIVRGLQWGCAVGCAAVLIRGASVPAQPKQIEEFRQILQSL
jgi:sugar/nucleoside kinase (ribokinase family)